MTKTGLCLLALAVGGAAACEHDDYDDGDYCYGDCDPDPVPLAVDDHIMIDEDQPITFAMLKANDENVNYLSKIIVPPEHGTFENGEYHPEPGYFGVDQFTYEGTQEYSSYPRAKSQATAYILIKSDGIPYEHSKLVGAANADDMAVGDFNGDGKTDLVTCNYNTNEMSIFINTTVAEGEYSLEKHVFEGGNSPRHLAAGDVDGDGKIDIVVATHEGVTMFRNLTTQPGGLLAFDGPTKLGNASTTDVELVDLQGDGVLDLVATSEGWYPSGNLDVWLNQSTPGTFAFGAKTSFSTPYTALQLMAVDADANGKPDLAILADEKLSLFLNAMTVGAVTPAFQARLDRDTGPNPKSMFLADLDGDAAPELGVLHDYGDMWIYANQGATSPTFEAARVIDIQTTTELVATAEVDGDGHIDLIGAAQGTAPFELLANRSLPQQYAFESTDALIADVDTHKRASFGRPTAMVFVDLDGVPPQEIVVSLKSGNVYSSAPGLRVLYGK
ncbi:MAG TPA: FG-GAP-like repeat-containing protein [Kofleriaceae bacterium]|nr:FG-GAP-like repeat-containing protein [Kofleriaceae bacterium]